ncbi:MAG TPA: Holliday junction resolvase [Methanoculleus sp.]|nr:Holliday junction resolvase [Methanoculleus sp.]
MSDFERDIVHCFNTFLSGGAMRGFAYRLKQSKFNSQYVDVLVDSLDPRLYLAVECKSIRGKKLYFSQHFHEDKHCVHQVDAISAFLEKTGRRGYLAVEFRSGPGKAKEAYLLPWAEVRRLYGEAPGIAIEEFRCAIPLARVADCYILEDLPKDI